MSLAFIGCHWAADKNGATFTKSRIRDARGVLEDMSVGGSEEGVDGHLLVHHVILLGDLNFRLAGKHCAPRGEERREGSKVGRG